MRHELADAAGDNARRAAMIAGYLRSSWRACGLIALLALVAIPTRSVAADRNDRFAALGAGIATCARFLEAREAQSKEYFLFGGWLDGYFSAQNQLKPDTFTLVPWQSVDILAGLVADFCRKNPQEAFLRAAMIMAQALEPMRLTEDSPRVAVSVGPFKAEFFRTILVRLQEKLRDAGHYDGPVGGDFDEQTADALKAYQSANSIDASGFPDQRTLFLLFHR